MACGFWLCKRAAMPATACNFPAAIQSPTGWCRTWRWRAATSTDQNLDGGDWRYYRVQTATNAPTNWVVTFSRTLGNASMFVRDTSPPGDGTSPGNYTATSPVNWSTDAKNQGPYPSFDSPGTCSLSTPPLRPGETYYLGFWSAVDTTFSLSWANGNGGGINITNFIAFYGGSFSNSIPGYGFLQYRMDVPPEATRIELNAANSANVALSSNKEPLPWLADRRIGPVTLAITSPMAVRPTPALTSFLNTGNNWPWLPGLQLLPDCHQHLAPPR